MIATRQFTPGVMNGHPCTVLSIRHLAFLLFTQATVVFVSLAGVPADRVACERPLSCLPAIANMLIIMLMMHNFIYYEN